MALTKVSYSMLNGAVANVLDFGAVSGAESTSAIQAAIDSIAATGGIVYFPSGTYKINAPIKIYSKISLVGAGQDTTTILKTTNTVGSGTSKAPSRTVTDSYVYDDLVQIWHEADEYAYYCKIQNLTLQKQTYAASSRGIFAPRCSHLNIEKVLIQNVNVGYLTYDCWMSTLSNVTTQAVSTGFYNADDGSGFGTGTSTLFNNCWINFDKTIVEPSVGYSIFGLTYSTFNSCGCDNGIRTDLGNVQGYLFNTCNSISLNGCGIENHQGIVLSTYGSTLDCSAFIALNIKGVAGGTTATVWVDGSLLTLTGSKFQPITSAGDTYNWIIQNSSSIVEINPYSSPTGGNAYISYSSKSSRSVINGSNTIVYNSSGSTSGAVSATATVPISIFTAGLGAYYIYAFVTNSGTNYRSCSLVTSDGITADITALKIGSNLNISLSGLDVQVTCDSTAYVGYSIIAATY